MLPISLELTNFQSFSSIKVDFDFTSVLILGERDNNADVSNGAGKSGLFEGMSWALWGRSRHKTADKVIKRGAEFCEADFVFEHEGKRYRIIRKRNARFSKLELMLFEFLPDGREKPIQGDTNKEIDERIREITKSNYDVFVNSCYFVQNTISEFLDGTPASKQQIIGSVMNLDRWNVYMKKAKADLDKEKIELGKVDFALKGKESVETDLVKAKMDLKDARATAQRLSNDESRLVGEIAELEKRTTDLRSQEAQLNDYHETVLRLENLVERRAGVEKLVREKSEDIDDFSRKILDNVRTIEALGVKVDEISSQIQIGSHIDLDTLEKSLIGKRTNLGWYTKRVREWDGVGICPCCSKQWDEHADKVAEHVENRKHQQSLQAEVNTLEEKVVAAKDALQKVKESEVEIEKYTGRQKNLEKSNEIYTLKKEVAERELCSATKSLEDLRIKEQAAQSRVDGFKEIAESSTFEKTRSLLKVKKIEHERVVEERNEVSYTVGGLTQKVKELEETTARKTELLAEAERITVQVSILESLYKSFGRNGIQAIIIDNVIEELTRMANEWLNEFCYESTHIRFITQKQDVKGGWKETLEIEIITPSGACDFESLSGGEAFRVAFAIRLALAQIQARRMGGETQILLLDEVSTSLDRHGLEMFVQIIRNLEQHMKVMVVTHDDKLKDEFSHILCVKKIGNDSSIEIR